MESIDKKLVFFDAQKSFLHSLNETGSFIFRALKKGKTVAEIAQLLSKTYAIDEKGAKHDVLNLITALAAQGILVTKKTPVAKKK